MGIEERTFTKALEPSDMSLCVPDSFTITSAALLFRLSLQGVCLHRQTKLNYKLFSEFYKTDFA